MTAAEIEARLTQLTVDELVQLVARANREYWDENAPTLPDPLYDRIVEQLRRLDPSAAILDELGPSRPGREALAEEAAAKLSPRERLGAPVAHSHPMLSLDKAYTADDVESWAAKL